MANNRKKTSGLVLFFVGLAAYVVGLVFLPDPTGPLPVWMIYAIPVPTAMGVLGVTQAVTGSSALEFFRRQKHYPGWKQALLNISVLGLLAFMAMNVILIYMARHKIAE